MQEYTVKIDDDSTIRWFKPGTNQFHRLDGPAIKYANGSKAWYLNGKRHRLDGPAVEYADGFKAWYQNGKRHRLDGPAIECVNGYKYWYIEDVKYTEAEFNAKVNPVKELTVAEIGELLGYEVKIIRD